ncbi:hepatic sodium/bile acid cotransporter [Discoglossus pictus]
MNNSTGNLWDLEETGQLFNISGPFQTSLSRALDVVTICLIITVMTSLGCTMDFSDIKKYLLKPKGIGIAVLAQYGIMPLTAFSLAHLFHLDAVQSVTIMIFGCCPGGNLSNVFTMALKGDMNLSIAMTACSTILAFGMMPLLLYIYSLGMDLGPIQNLIPYTKIAICLILTIFPCCFGIFLKSKIPQYSHYIVKTGMVIFLMTSVMVLILAVTYVNINILVLLTPKLLCTAALLPGIGYILGYSLGAIFKLDQRLKCTICMETGCQNVQICLDMTKKLNKVVDGSNETQEQVEEGLNGSMILGKYTAQPAKSLQIP